MKYAFLINSSLEEPAPLTNTLEYVRKLDDAGHDVVVFFDGEATQWIPELEGDEDRLADEVYADVRDRGLVGGGVWLLCLLFRGRPGDREDGNHLGWGVGRTRSRRRPVGRTGLSAAYRRLIGVGRRRYRPSIVIGRS